MLYEELQKRYGNHIAKRVKRDLTRHEFSNVPLENLPGYLEQRAEKAAIEYKTIMDNPLDRGGIRSEVLQSHWRAAEDLAYLLSVAEDVSSTVRSNLAAS